MIKMEENLQRQNIIFEETLIPGNQDDSVLKTGN
jgi:hypothetical protein